MRSSFAADLRCPDDGHLLSANDKGRVKFGTCRHCDGLWFGSEAIHSRFRAKLPDTTASKRRKGPPKTGRRCPQCASKLTPEDVEGLRPPSVFARAFDRVAEDVAHLITELAELNSSANEPLLRLSLRRKRRVK